MFNQGLLSEQINPAALENLQKREKTNYAQEENIGTLVYTSSYKPINNKQGKTIGFINLQHFGQQEDYENQIQDFLAAIINVFMFFIGTIYNSILSDFELVNTTAANTSR